MTNDSLAQGHSHGEKAVLSSFCHQQSGTGSGRLMRKKTGWEEECVSRGQLTRSVEMGASFGRFCLHETQQSQGHGSGAPEMFLFLLQSEGEK